MTRNAIRWLGLALAFFALSFSVHAQSLQITVAPTNIVWDTNTWVTLTITNLTPGASVDVRLYADIDRNGVLSGPDVLVGDFPVQDGAVHAAHGGQFGLELRGSVIGKRPGQGLPGAMAKDTGQVGENAPA